MSFPGRTPAPRVLLINDDVSVSDVFARTLRLEGFEIWAGLSVTEGLTLAGRHHPHAVVIDLRMPASRGIEVIRTLRGLPGLDHVPVALVTGDHYLSATQTETVRALGTSLHYKPVWIDELVGVARELAQVAVTL